MCTTPRVTKTIRQTDSLSEAETQHLYGWDDDIFGADVFKLRWRPKDLHFLLEIDGDAVSHVGVLKHEISVAREPVKVGGGGGVVTLPAWQRRGYARELMQHTWTFLAGGKLMQASCFVCRGGWRFISRKDGRSFISPLP